MIRSAFLFSLCAILAGCATQIPVPAQAPAPLTVPALLSKPLFQMTPIEAGRYIAHMQQSEPDLRKRIAAIGRQNIGQPYILNLLGEFPYQLHDNLPMYSLTHSDCVVFAEHTYAMALSSSWEEFFWMLQRIRYTQGVIGVATRNHYTELDWNVQNSWLVTDVTATLAGPATATYMQTVDRQKFLKTRHGTDAPFAVQTAAISYIPKEKVAEIASQLQAGDFVNVISTQNGGSWASHVGLVVVDAQGRRNFLHSSEPQVREESFDSYIGRMAERDARNALAGKKSATLAGFKFLRLNDNIVVPPAAPQPRPQGVAVK
jgi:hypothetical protein